MPAPIRLGFRALSEIWPSKAEDLGSWLFCHPKRAPIRPAEQQVMDEAHRFTLEVEGFRLAAWSWGDGPLVVLHHGWGGRASQMSAFVGPLVAAGFSVTAYDAPAHGESPGSITGAPEIARILRAVEKRMMGVHAVIGHSLGAAATLLAIGDGLAPDRAVLLAPPSDMRGFVEIFAEHVGMNPRRVQGIGDRAARRFDSSWGDMHLGHWARADHPPLLVFHDREDEVVTIDNAREIVGGWRDAELVETTGLGHRRIRRDAAVIDRAVAFLREGLGRDQRE